MVKNAALLPLSILMVFVGCHASWPERACTRKSRSTIVTRNPVSITARAGAPSTLTVVVKTSLVPRPHPQKEEKGLVNLGRILGPSLAPRTCGYVIGIHLGIQLMALRAWGASLECI